MNGLTQELDNYIFQKVGLRRIMLDYKNNGPYKKNDANGKELFDDLAAELSSNGKSREYLIDIVIRYMNANESQRVNKIVTFLKNNSKTKLIILFDEWPLIFLIFPPFTITAALP